MSLREAGPVAIEATSKAGQVREVWPDHRLAGLSVEASSLEPAKPAARLMSLKQ